MEMAKLTSKGQITVPVDVRRKLGLNEGNRLLFLEQGNGYFVVNESRIDLNKISGRIGKTNAFGWSPEYIDRLKQFAATPDMEFVEPEELPWTVREELL
ncbi:MAG: AbrB/MazE/SpoVT family DNA-binding domain-containing protein [Clostridiales bacterium]|nr:AbrB/MazE/SpoVT family DNA-binding domain-containing protein [Clostridiales bacterium]